MATANTEENITESNKNGDKDGSDESPDLGDDSDSASSGEEPSGTQNKPSMFCRSCFLPYSGAQKSGTFVLKCEGCGQTDTIEEEQASGLNEEEFSGNLMMNRFFKVIRATENINVNVGDPDFVDDNLKGLDGAMTDYALYLNCITAKVAQLAQEEKREREKYKSQIESGGQGASQGDVADRDDETNKLNKVAIREKVMKEILAHRDSVVDIIAFIIEKHNLPEDIWTSLEEKIDNPGTITWAHCSGQGETGENDASKNLKSDIGATNNETREGCGKAESESDDEQDETRAKMKYEILVKLRSKFNFGFHVESNKEFRDSDMDRMVDEKNKQDAGISNEDEDDDSPILEGEISKLWDTKFTVRPKRDSNLDKVLASLLKNTNIIKEEHAARKENSTETKSEGKGANEKRRKRRKNSKRKGTSEDKVKEIDTVVETGATASNDDAESDGFEVTFTDISQAFVDILQRRKRDALANRQEKAKEILIAKITAIRQQVGAICQRNVYPLTPQLGPHYFFIYTIKLGFFLDIATNRRLWIHSNAVHKTSTQQSMF